MGCARAVFMPDLVADRSYDLTITSNGESHLMAINKGDWWANTYAFLLHFWEHSGYNPEFKPYLFETGANGYLRQVSFTLGTLDVGAGTATVDWDGVTGGKFQMLFNERWSGGNSFDSGPVSGLYSDGHPILDSWYTTYPLVEYSRGISVQDGTATRAQSGEVYSVRGTTQEYRNVKVQFDMQAFAAEYYHWTALWRFYWTVGRSVSLYTDDAIIEAEPSEFAWGSTGAGRCESLVAEAPDTPLWMQRLNLHGEVGSDVYRANLWTDQETRKFYVRKPRNMAALQTDFGLRELT